ncbi:MULTISPECIES: hypothetical protein [Okeania]|nr:MULTISPECIES: hypothetical protein [Okeania]
MPIINTNTMFNSTLKTNIFHASLQIDGERIITSELSSSVFP